MRCSASGGLGFRGLEVSVIRRLNDSPELHEANNVRLSPIRTQNIKTDALLVK